MWDKNGPDASTWEMNSGDARIKIVVHTMFFLLGKDATMLVPSLQDEDKTVRDLDEV